MKVKVKEITEGCFPVRTNNSASDCFDLILAENVIMKAGEVYVARLGVAMQLPKGCVARVYSRSSSPSKLGVTLANGIGFIDNAYNGDMDEWRCPMYAFKDVELEKGTRICQFEIVPSQFSKWYQKIKWLFSSFTLKRVSKLSNDNRGGIGSTGV